MAISITLLMKKEKEKKKEVGGGGGGGGGGEECPGNIRSLVNKCPSGFGLH